MLFFPPSVQSVSQINFGDKSREFLIFDRRPGQHIIITDKVTSKVIYDFEIVRIFKHNGQDRVTLQDKLDPQSRIHYLSARNQLPLDNIDPDPEKTSRLHVTLSLHTIDKHDDQKALFKITRFDPRYLLNLV